ncbi:hypothetical protein GJ744_007395 [Endocarpon pusillum]|uniref:Uncharacterized protein n=1 Tax=Endocarpon pusillum TaxID=364733 RepID=A0A8H7AM35_9EURO|nr:hypothetical protein GJ744_007395 [Endocarpon pusillum]
MITVLGSVCMALCTIPQLQTIKWRPYRTIMFVSVGLSGVLPMSHAVRLFGIDQAKLQMGWSWFVLEAVFYITGAIIYATRMPERWMPGRFDLFGSSHQLFHHSTTITILELEGAKCLRLSKRLFLRTNHRTQKAL